jgi:hypothetical protein
MEELQLKEEASTPTPQTTPNPEDLAAQHFKSFLPRYDSLVNKLSLKSLKRLAKSLVAYPLEDRKHVHRKGDEEEALKLGESLMQSKFVMFMTNLYKLSKEELEKQKSEQSSSEEKEGDTNGKESNTRVD